MLLAVHSDHVANFIDKKQAEGLLLLKHRIRYGLGMLYYFLSLRWGLWRILVCAAKSWDVARVVTLVDRDVVITEARHARDVVGVLILGLGPVKRSIKHHRLVTDADERSVGPASRVQLLVLNLLHKVLVLEHTDFVEKLLRPLLELCLFLLLLVLQLVGVLPLF